jgi:hypothetical protein
MSSDPQAARAAADELLARIRATPHNGKVFQADDADYLMAIAAKLESGTAVALAGDWYRQMGLRVRATLAAVARLTRERDRLRAACELTLRWLRGEVIERSVRDAIAEALAQPGDGAAGGGRG